MDRENGLKRKLDLTWNNSSCKSKRQHKKLRLLEEDEERYSLLTLLSLTQLRCYCCCSDSLLPAVSLDGFLSSSVVCLSFYRISFLSLVVMIVV